MMKLTPTLFVVSLALFTDMLVYGIIIPILPKILSDFHRQPSDLGLLVASYALGLLIFTPLFGVLSDKYQTRKIPFLAGLFGLIACTFLFAFATSIEMLFIARFCQGVSGGSTWSIGLSMVADQYASDSAQLGSAMGFIMGANVLGQLMGPPIGGFLFEYVSPRSPFYFCVALAFIDFVARLFVSSEVKVDASAEVETLTGEPASPAPRESAEVSKHTIISMIFHMPLFLDFLATFAASNIFSAMEPVLPLYFKKIFDASASTTGILFSLIVLPNIILSTLAGTLSDKYGRKQVSSLGLVSMAVLVPLLALGSVAGIYVEGVVLVALGSVCAFALTPILPDMAEIVNPPSTQTASATSKQASPYGQVYALFNISYSLGMITGPIIGAFLYEWIAFLWDMCFFSAFLLVVGLWVGIYARYHTGRRYLVIPAEAEGFVGEASDY